MPRFFAPGGGFLFREMLFVAGLRKVETMVKNKQAQPPIGEPGPARSTNNIIPHPKRILKSLPPDLQQRARREYRAIAGSGQHLDRFALLSAWSRQTRIPQVWAALEQAFSGVGRGA